MKFYDNTRLQDASFCNRRYYWRHVRHLVPLSPAVPLVFGSCWHTAMDVVWKGISDKPSVSTIDLAAEAMKAFEHEWMEEGFPSAKEFLDMEEDDHKAWLPRTPLTAYEMIFCYIEERRNFIKRCEVLSIERPFVVALAPEDIGYMYCGIMDKETRREGRVYGIEHKTTTLYRRDGPFRSDFLESFSPNRQIDGYLHYLRSKYGREAKAVWVDAALVHKDHHDQFRFLPCERIYAQLGGWLWETHEAVAAIERQHEALKLYRQDTEGGAKHAEYLPAFPKNTSACTLYGNCPYIELCRASANPEATWPNGKIPPGFKEKAWSPFKENELEKLGYIDDGVAEGVVP